MSFHIGHEIEKATREALGTLAPAEIALAELDDWRIKEAYYVVYDVGDKSVTMECSSLWNAQAIARRMRGQAVADYSGNYASR